MNFEQLTELPHSGGVVEGNPCLSFSSDREPQLSTKTNLDGIGRTWARFLVWGKEPKNVYQKRFRIIYLFISIVLGIKQGSALSREKKPNNHLEINLCVSLSARLRTGGAQKETLRCSPLLLIALGLFFVRDRSSELCKHESWLGETSDRD